MKYVRRLLPFVWILVVLIIPIMKIIGSIDWSWVWVTLPIWLPVLALYSLPAVAIVVVILTISFKSIQIKWS